MNKSTTMPLANNQEKRVDRVPSCLTTSSQQLFRGSTEVQIEHRGEIYRLRITRQEKLILTK